MWDIALIKLKVKFPKIEESMQYVLNPICLPTRDRIPGFGTESTTLFGFGLIEDKNAIIFKEKEPEFLQKAHLYVSACINNTMFCNSRTEPTEPGICNVSI